MKKIAGLILLLVYSFCTVSTVWAKPIFDNDFSSLPDGWESSVTSGTVEAADGMLKLSYDSEAASARAKAEVDTEEYNFEGKKLKIAMSFTMSGADDSTRRALVLTDDDEWDLHASDLLTISNKTAVFFADSTVSRELIENREYSLELYMDMSDESQTHCVAYLDGERIYDKNNMPFSVNFSAMKLRMRNYLSKKASFKADWIITGFAAEDMENPRYSLNISDGETIVKGKLEGIEITYSGEFAPEVFSEDNYSLLKNGETENYTVTAENSAVTVIPESGFESGNEYTLNIKNISDIFGNVLGENISNSVLIVPEGYEIPKIFLSPNISEKTIREGEVFRVEAEAVSDAFEKLEFVVDGEIKYSSSKKKDVFEFSGAAGQYEVYAVAYDSIGCKTVSDTISVTVTKNDLPQISFKDYSVSARLTPEQAKSVKIIASDSDGIDKVRIFADGKELTEAEKISDDEYAVDLSVCGAGETMITARAYDLYGASSNAVLTINIYVNAYMKLFEDKDFSGSGTGTINFKSGITGYSRRGYVDTYQVDEEHGNSLRIGIETADESFGGSDFPYVIVPVDYSDLFETNFEIYFSEKPDSSSRFIYALFQTSGSRVEAALAGWDSVLKIGEKSFDYETGKWYKVNTVINVAGKTAELTVTDDSGKIIAKQAVEINNAITVINQMRFYGSSKDIVSYYAAVDNILMNKIAGAPNITRLGADGTVYEDGIIPYDAEYIEVYLDKKIYNFEKSVISLASGGRKTEIKKAGYDEKNNKIIIYPEAQLSPNAEYTVVLSEDTQMFEGIKTGIEIKANFKTSAGDIGISDISFTKSGQTLTANSGISNQGNGQKRFILIVTVWNKDEFRGIFADEQRLDAGQNGTLSVTVPQLLSGERAEACIWDSFTNAVIYGKETYNQ